MSGPWRRCLAGLLPRSLSSRAQLRLWAPVLPPQALGLVRRPSQQGVVEVVPATETKGSGGLGLSSPAGSPAGQLLWAQHDQAWGRQRRSGRVRLQEAKEVVGQGEEGGLAPPSWM